MNTWFVLNFVRHTLLSDLQFILTLLMKPWLAIYALQSSKQTTFQDYYYFYYYYQFTIKDPNGKQRNQVTKFISENKSRQEFIPPLGKNVDLIKAEPLHNTNNGWQLWFQNILTIAMIYTKTPNSTPLSDVPSTTPLMKLMKYIKGTALCTRLFKRFQEWFNEKRQKSIPFSYRFTGMESKRFVFQ